MDRFQMFKRLLRMQDVWKNEEIIIMLFHSFFLDSNFIIDESIKEPITTEGEDKNKKENYKIEITKDGFMKCTIQKEGKEDVYISKILLPPYWRKDASHYTFSYKHAYIDIKLQMNFSKSGDMLTVILKEIGTTSNAVNYIIPTSEYVTMKEGSVQPEQVENLCKLKELESIFMNQLIRKMHCVGTHKDASSSISSSNIYGSEISNSDPRIISSGSAMGIEVRERFELGPTGKIPIEGGGTTHIGLEPPTPMFLSDFFRNDIFDDKNPCIGNHIFRDRRTNVNNPNILKPDGLLIGPNHQFFNPGHMRYDPIGPFGLEPNSDRRFDFNNNFPF